MMRPAPTNCEAIPSLSVGRPNSAAISRPSAPSCFDPTFLILSPHRETKALMSSMLRTRRTWYNAALDDRFRRGDSAANMTRFTTAAVSCMSIALEAVILACILTRMSPGSAATTSSGCDAITTSSKMLYGVGSERAAVPPGSAKPPRGVWITSGANFPVSPASIIRLVGVMSLAICRISSFVVALRNAPLVCPEML